MITLATLSEATEQEVFSQIKEHMLKQNKRASTLKGSCKYRIEEENGQVLKCAAGCLIADDEYKIEFDEANNSTWDGLIEEDLVPDAHRGLIADMQALHDGVEPEQWEQQLLRYAVKHDLSF